MDELSEIVRRAQAGDVEAFTEIVQRFQGMAYGYGFSLLGDFQLAQDAAQEAFVDAFHKLDQLREPAAFAGWFRRIVFKQCDRLKRRKKPDTVSVDHAEQIVSDLPGPEELALRNHMLDEVVRAISDLPEHERTVTSLYYVDGYSQGEIASFLEVPEGTIKSRLYSSRKRLKERMMGMVDETMKAKSLPDDFASKIVRRVSTEADLEGAKRYLVGSYHERRAPEKFASVDSAHDAGIYVVSDSGNVESAGFYGEFPWAFGDTLITVARPEEFAGESLGVPDPLFVKSVEGSFRMARDAGRSLAIMHGSMFDHGFCGLVPTFYYAVATLPVDAVSEMKSDVVSRAIADDDERERAVEAHLRDPYSAKISAFLGGGCWYALELGGESLGYYRANPDVFEKAARANMLKPFGYVNSITTDSREASIAILKHAARLAADAGEAEIRILESHQTQITKTVLALGGSYLLRPSCPNAGLDAEMAAILDLQALTHELRDEFERRIRATGHVPSGDLSIEMDGTVVRFEWDGKRLLVSGTTASTHLQLPRWLATRLYMGYYSGADVLGMGHLPWDRSDGLHCDAPGKDLKRVALPGNEAALFGALFPKLWPTSLPDPDVWPWVIGKPGPAYQHEDAKTPELKSRIDALRFPWIGY